MTKLEAVNLILRALSEHTVASTEIRHPSITLALDWLDIAREELTGERWWFNCYPIVLGLQTDGRIQVPDNALEFVPDQYQGIIIGGYLYNADDATFIFASSVRGTITYDTQYDDLPAAAQRAVAYQAAIYAYMNDVGDQVPVHLQQGLASAVQQLSAGHARQRRYNARMRRQWQHYENARRG